MGATPAIVIGRLSSNPTLNDKGNALFSIESKSFDDAVNTHRIIAKGRIATQVMNHLMAGDLCCIEGKFVKRDDAIFAERITFLASKKIRGEQ